MNKGLTESIVREISKIKGEPEWMLLKRLEGLKQFNRLNMPKWGPDLTELDWNSFTYYLDSHKKKFEKWENVPQVVKETFERIGVPKAEREVLAGVKNQWDSEVIYGSLKKYLSDKGVIFLSMDEGLSQYPEIVAKYWGTVVPADDNKLAALNTAVWSGGSFVYIPKGIKVELPLQAYFRIESERLGQFERTLIVAEEESSVHYIEGCSAPVYSSASLHAGVVEVIVMRGAKVQYSTVQNWYKNVYNLVTKRAMVYEDAQMKWVDGNIGSKTTMKYPSCILAGRGARGEMLSVAWAGEGQIQDTGAKMIHLASDTSSNILSKSVSKDGGMTNFRGLVRIGKKAKRVKTRMVCENLLLDENSKAESYPTIKVENNEAQVEHEAKVSKLSAEQLFYVMSRGIPEEEAEGLLINGFLSPIIRQIPMEYAVELNRLIMMEIENG